MTVTDHSTDDGWRYRWTRDDGVHFELEWCFGRLRWLRRTAVADGGWNAAQDVALPSPADADDARRLAEHHAGRSA